MGIPYYFYKLTQKYNNIVTNAKPNNVSTEYKDFNVNIHNIAHNIIYNSEITNIEDQIIE